jgi:rubrerythrin
MVGLEVLRMLIAGEDHAENGRYQCIECGHIVTVDEDSDELAPCPCCGDTIFQEIR